MIADSRLVPGASAGADRILEGWLARQEGIRTWSADFIQTRTLKTLAQPVVARGRVRFAAPNRFHWEIGDPPQTIAVRQSNAVLVIYPPLRRVERYPLDAASGGPWKQMLSLLEAGFPESRPQLESRFRVVSMTDTAEAHELTLEPRNPGARRLMPRFRVRLSPAQLDLQSTEMEFADGSRLRNDFTNAVANPTLDEALFVPVFEGDYRITEPLARARP